MRTPRRKAARRGDAVGQWIQSMPQAFIECRDLGHVWRPWRASWDGAESEWRRVMRCDRCHAERTQSVSTGGFVLSGHYTYTDGYSKPSGTGSYDRDERASLRLESIMRIVLDEPGQVVDGSVLSVELPPDRDVAEPPERVHVVEAEPSNPSRKVS